MSLDPYMAYYYRQLQQQQHRYLQQDGGSITQVFRGAPNQRGHGVGSFLGGMFRTIGPLIKSGMKAVGGEALRSGVGFLRDITDGTTDPKVSANARLRQFTESLKRKADDKMSRVLNGGGTSGVGDGGGPCAKRRRVARKTNAQRATRNAKRVMCGGRQQSKVTPQSLTRLLRGKTYKSRKSALAAAVQEFKRKKKVRRAPAVRRRQQQQKKKSTRTSVRDIFS